jgi:periplasmic protein TonB
VRRERDPHRVMKFALMASLVVHAVLLSIHFEIPQAIGQASEKALDVILVNAKHKSAPVKAQAKAQNNLDGGGNVEEDRRAKTPLPPAPRTREGSELAEAQRKVAQLEAMQQQMLTALNGKTARPAAQASDQPQPDPVRSGLDLASSARAMIQLDAEISRRMEEYNQRPRRKFIGARTQEYRFAQYVEDWRQKIERIGNLNYPDAARGKVYGSLVLTVVIKASGELERVEINRSSGKPVLDQAAQRIVRLAAPYAAFPDAIRADTDLLEITRTWSFTQTDQLRSD